MKKLKLDRYMMRCLRKEKGVRLSIPEKLFLGWHGRQDGIHGLPREDAVGEWVSPMIQRELNSYNEAYNKILGTLQMKQGEKYRRADEISEKLEHYRERMDELKERVSQKPTEEQLGKRRHGEEGLADSQIYNRRLKEHEKGKEKYRMEMEEMSKSAETEYKELIEIKSYLEQRNYEAEMICERIKSHMQQRIDYYWNEANRISCKNERSMPPVFTKLQIPDSFEKYKMFCRERRQRWEGIVGQYNEREASEHEKHISIESHIVNSTV